MEVDRVVVVSDHQDGGNEDFVIIYFPPGCQNWVDGDAFTGIHFLNG